MPTRTTNLLLLAALLPSLSGCQWLFGNEGYFRDRQEDYRKAQVTPKMRVPEDLDKNSMKDLYPIPDQDSSTLLVGDFEVPRPEPLRAAETQALVRIQKLADEQWILMENTPSEVWPQVRSFVIRNQLGPDGENVELGLMETAWLSREDEPAYREKYRYRVEQGIQRRSSEIYVQHYSLNVGDLEDAPMPEQLDWPQNSIDKGRETWMVQELANWLAATADSSSVSLMAQGLSTASKMYLIRDDNGRPVIDLRLPYDRAWASLGRALQKAQFTVTDLDRESGRYYVRYEPSEEEEGWFSSLWNFGDDSGSSDPYVVDLVRTGEGVHIGISREDGEHMEDEELDVLLGAIRGNLS